MGEWWSSSDDEELHYYYIVEPGTKMCKETAQHSIIQQKSVN